MNSQRDQWTSLWNKAKELEALVPVRKREAFVEIYARFPELKYKNFGTLVRANREGRLSNDISVVVDGYEQQINTLVAEARENRQQSEHLLAQRRRADTRKILDPRTDAIPPGQYPKLRECKTYPLRRACNYGENTTSRWERCEYMKYDNSKSIFDPTRWTCTAAE